MPRAFVFERERVGYRRMAPRRDEKKRLGKKHRQASTRPKKGKAPQSKLGTQAVTGAVAPKARKKIATKRAEAAKKGEDASAVVLSLRPSERLRRMGWAQ